METARPNLLTREDTLLGVCQAIGEDVGINPLFLRVALAFGLFLNPVAVIATYAVAGVVVLASRLLFPAGRAAAPAQAQQSAAEPVTADNDDAAPLAAAA